MAGVVNIIMRKDFEGAEVSLSHGGTTGPSYDETAGSFVWGSQGKDSNVTLILDYFAYVDNRGNGPFWYS